MTNPKNQVDLEQHISGRTFAKAISASVQTLLVDVGKRVPVYLREEQFYNANFWPLRIVIGLMCDWAKKNPGKKPTRSDIQSWVHEANRSENARDKAYIVLPQIPRKLSPQRALAYEGGAYHEALHSLYSKNDRIRLSDVEDDILTMWDAVENWAPYAKMLQGVSNLIEDVYIERCGVEEYPNIYEALVAVHDFIIGREHQSYLEAKAKNPEFERTPLTIVELCFRAYGKGYSSPAILDAIERYKQQNYDAWSFTVHPDSLMRAILEEAIGHWETPEEFEEYKADNTMSLRLALKYVATVDHMIKKFKARVEHEPCQHCGAPASKIGYMPSPNEGKVIRICTECEARDEVDIPEKKELPKNEDVLVEYEESDDLPFWIIPPPFRQQEDPDPQLEEERHPELEDDKTCKESKPKRGGISLELPGLGKRCRDFEPDVEEKSGDEEGDDEGPAISISQKGAGGHGSSNDYDEHGIDFEAFAATIESEAKDQGDIRTSDAQMIEASTALKEALKEMKEGIESGLESGEMWYNPVSTEADTVAFVDDGGDSERARARARALIESVVDESAALRARFRSIFRSLVVNTVTHGHRRGKKLSGRRLVDNVISMKTGEYPKRPFKKTNRGIDTSLAAAIVLDESGSMGGILTDATRMMVALAEPIDQIGGKLLVTGIRDTYSDVPYLSEDGLNDYYRHRDVYHRYGSVHYDVFQHWSERFNAINWRYSRTIATGGTPLADGVQYGLNALSDRNEQFRFLFVITDGVPNPPHEKVIRLQCRLARQSGIYVIGIGVGRSAEYVKVLFDDSVYSPNVSQIPQLLIKKLNEIADQARRMRRGQKMLPTSNPNAA